MRTRERIDKQITTEARMPKKKLQERIRHETAKTQEKAVYNSSWEQTLVQQEITMEEQTLLYIIEQEKRCVSIPSAYRVSGCIMAERLVPTKQHVVPFAQYWTYALCPAFRATCPVRNVS